MSGLVPLTWCLGILGIGAHSICQYDHKKSLGKTPSSGETTSPIFIDLDAHSSYVVGDLGDPK